MADPSRQKPTEPWRLPPEPWQRFTLLDLFLLQFGFALGFSAAAILKPKEASAVFVLVAGSFFAALACGPIVLWVQWAIRDRWASLSAGEWLWLATSALYGLAVCAGVFVEITESGNAFALLAAPVVVAWLLAQGFCGLVALVVLLKRFDGGSSVACRWTDWAGLIVTLLVLPLTCLTTWLIDKGR